MIGFNDAGIARTPSDGSRAHTSGTIAREGIFDIPGPVQLHFGGRLDGVRIAWSLTGAAHGPVVIALGGISAGRRVTGTAGWWSELVGPGQALDTERCQVLGIDYLGGSGESTGPKRGERPFPSVSAYDQADVLRHLLLHLDLAPVQAIVGASYGGMVALA